MTKYLKDRFRDSLLLNEVKTKMGCGCCGSKAKPKKKATKKKTVKRKKKK
tara:strand:+ start:10049 stop:10198 length:150 start_codon:yes stop_codon:yes gene_type:complete